MSAEIGDETPAYPQPGEGEKLWCVLSPELEYTDYIGDLGSGPREQYRDAVYVTAKTKREAKIKGLREFRAGHSDAGGGWKQSSEDWLNWGQNPMGLMEPRVMEPCPIHRYRFEECLCEAPDDAEGEGAG